MEKINFEQGFVSKYPQYKYLLDYMHEALHLDEIHFSDLTSLNLNAFAGYLLSKVSRNSANTYFSKIKGFLNMVCDEVELPTTKFPKILRCKREPQQNVALTEEEVSRIDHYYQDLKKKGRRHIEKEVLAKFLIECYCGGRGVDVDHMTLDNINDGRLTYVSQKTHTLATMPAHHRLYDLLRDKSDKEYSRETKNSIVKRVCKKCGIDEEISLYYHGKQVTKKKYEYCGFHTARRSFASMLATKGVPVPEIKQYMSHSDIQMTERYIIIDRNHSSEAAMEFFGDKDKDRDKED